MRSESSPCFITQLVESFRFEDARLPSLPNAVVYLERAVRDDTLSMQKLAELLANDPVLAARLVRVANSTFYRSVSPVETVPSAVTRIGLSATRNIALVLLKNSFKARHKLVSNTINELWLQSLRTAAVASALSHHYPLVDSNRALLGGLMYNVGAMLLLTKIDEQVREIKHVAVINHMISRHAQLFGVKLLEHWSMDPDLLEIVANRDNWGREHNEPPDLADLILVARCCIAEPDGTLPDLAFCEALPSYARISRFMQLGKPLSEVVAEAEESINQTLDLLGDA